MSPSPFFELFSLSTRKERSADPARCATMPGEGFGEEAWGSGRGSGEHPTGPGSAGRHEAGGLDLLVVLRRCWRCWSLCRAVWGVSPLRPSPQHPTPQPPSQEVSNIAEKKSPWALARKLWVQQLGSTLRAKYPAGKEFFQQKGPAAHGPLLRQAHERRAFVAGTWRTFSPRPREGREGS